MIVRVFIVSLIIGLSFTLSAYADISETPDISIRKLDPQLMISATVVFEEQKRDEDIVLIDVRSKGEFEKIRIPGSVNIPIYSVKTKFFLKTKQVVLINEGHTYSRLEEECRKLLESGFASVSILEGGLNAWREKGGQLEGDTFAIESINRISPRIFFSERDYEHWLVIDISAAKKPESADLFCTAIHVPFSGGTAENFVSELNSVLSRREKTSARFILIVNEEGKAYKAVERVISRAGIKNVFYLKGGLEGYDMFVKNHALILESKGNVQESESCK